MRGYFADNGLQIKQYKMTERVEDLPLGLETNELKTLEIDFESESINRKLIEITNKGSERQKKIVPQTRNIKSKTEYTVDQKQQKNCQIHQKRYENFLDKADTSSRHILEKHNYRIKTNQKESTQNIDKTPLPNMPRIRESNSLSNLNNHLKFKSKQYKEQMLIRDLEKNPWKYRIPCKMLGCKPDDVFGMKKAQYQFIQEQYKKQKGLQYLREGNSRIKSSVKIGVKQFNNTREKSKEQKIVIKKRQKSLKQKIQKLAQKQLKQGQVVFQRVKKYLTVDKQDYYRHLNSEQSVDKALITFLKTKVQRAEMSLM